MFARLRRAREHFKGLAGDAGFAFLYHPAYRRDIVIGILSFLIALLSFALAWSAASPVGLLVAVAGFAFATWELRSAWQTRRRITGIPEGGAVVTRALTHVRAVGDYDLPIASLEPDQTEAALGFVRHNARSCPDTAFASAEIDDQLSQAVSIGMSSRQVTGEFVSTDEDQRDHQLSYLYHKTHSNTRTTNEAKVRLVSALDRLADTVQLERTDYFRSLMTAEAFRSELVIRYANGSIFRHSNGTRWFPASEQGGVPHLMRHPVAGISGHIGTTPFALSADGYPMFASQDPLSAQSAKALVMRGSGSMDWADLRAAGDGIGFAGVVAQSVAREMVEETNSRLRNRNVLFPGRAELIRRIREAIVLTGFFRWVDRAGKPEFICAVRLPDQVNLTDFDNYEVTYHPIIEQIGPMHTDKDVIALWQMIADHEDQLVGLSTLMAIRRAAEICGYGVGSSDHQRTIKAKLLAALGLQEA